MKRLIRFIRLLLRQAEKATECCEVVFDLAVLAVQFSFVEFVFLTSDACPR